ncbi:hypothetical protein SVI_1266 [Shewanella violacea DSS12]|uniref:Uncharacterized protein n=1 Tax=Shewanella violacea (strain JCM 10179 / CIP 106290 / LMG 19151 / DSS12) TaxID=637905 RepID=D4ZHT8_SHEVD|nr:hypothetical protein SVI_1266 [Shewanella violacea DSS12]
MLMSKAIIIYIMTLFLLENCKHEITGKLLINPNNRQDNNLVFHDNAQ